MKALTAALAVICWEASAEQQINRPRHVVGSQQYHDSWVNKPDFDSSYKAYEDIKTIKKLEHGLRPVIGVLSEPLRGDLLEDSLKNDSGYVSYIPKTHVQFLEQAGMRVVPIDYHLNSEERLALFEKINGVYVPGDSHLTATDEEYKAAFMHVLDYTTEQAKINQEHFPVFFMGNTLTTLVKAISEMKGRLSPMDKMLNQVYPIALLGQPDDHILFNGMTQKEY